MFVCSLAFGVPEQAADETANHPAATGARQAAMEATMATEGRVRID
jgi:hypothetical protein